MSDKLATIYRSKAREIADRHYGELIGYVDLVAAAEEALLSNGNRIATLEASMALLKIITADQAEDEGLWFIAQTAPEAYLQEALRRLHAAIERK
jgi:hypothetical protein